MNQQKMTSFVYFAVSLIAIAVSQDQLPGVEQIVPETAMRIAPKAPHATLLEKVDASFYQKSKAEIAEMMESGKSKKECRDAAKEMQKQVEESVKAQQEVLDKMERGKQCAMRGQKAVNDAAASLGGKKDKVKAAKKALQKARKKKINFGDFSWDQLTKGKCGSFFNQQVWKAADTAVTQAINTLNSAKTNQKAAEKVLANAKIEAVKLVRKCKCNTKKLLGKTRTDMNNKARAGNTKAWRKGAHLQCVLDGKQNMNNCPVGTLPEVKPVKLEKSVEKACFQEWQSKGTANRVLNAAGKKVKFTLYALPNTKGWVSNNVNSKNRYIKICKDEGMVPVGCSEVWPKWDCGKRQGRNNCMSLPQGFQCNAIAPARRITNFKGNLIGYWTNGEVYNGNSYFKTTAGVPSTSQMYHPLCGRYGTTQGWPKDY